jgi:hypothetical protein
MVFIAINKEKKEFYIIKNDSTPVKPGFVVEKYIHSNVESIRSKYSSFKEVKNFNLNLKYENV